MRISAIYAVVVGLCVTSTVAVSTVSFDNTDVQVNVQGGKNGRILLSRTETDEADAKKCHYLWCGFRTCNPSKGPPGCKNFDDETDRTVESTMDVASAAAVLTAVTDLAISTLAVAVSNTSSKDNFGAVSTHTLTSTGTVTGPVDAQGKATADPIAIADNGREGIKSCYDCDQVYQRCINMSNIAFSHSPAQSE